MPIKVITPPTLSSILTTAELRAQCRIDGTDLDGARYSGANPLID